MIYKSLPSCIRIFPVGRDQFCKVTSPENTTRDVFRSRKFTLFYQEEFQIIPGQGQRGGQTRHSCSYNDTIEFVIHIKLFKCLLSIEVRTCRPSPPGSFHPADCTAVIRYRHEALF